MSETDLQLGGGYTYQWECAILFALNYFFETVRLNPALDDLVDDFLGQVEAIQLEGESREERIDLEDINLVRGERRILIQVKTKQAEGERWTLTDPLLLKALFRFYNSSFLQAHPGETRFVFLTNRPFNPDLVQLNKGIGAGKVNLSADAKKLYDKLNGFAIAKTNKAIDEGRFYQMLSQTLLVEYLSVDAVKGNIQNRLQALGRRDWQAAHAVLFERFARQSTRIGGGKITPEFLGEALGTPLEVYSAQWQPPAVKTTWTVPYRSLGEGFVGRQADLDELHRRLGEQVRVGITGMGGAGKTQLAVEYAHRHREEYPHGAFWLNATKPLLQELAALAETLGLGDREMARDQAAFKVRDYLEDNPQALLVFDNLDDPASLNLPIAAGLIPAELKCRLLFTTRQRNYPDNLRLFEIKVLPEEASLRLLLRGRQEVLDPTHPEHAAAKKVVIALGRLPLALELAAAYLDKFKSKTTLNGYLELVSRKGGLGALDLSVQYTKLSKEELATRHSVAIAAALEQQWQALEDPDARKLFIAAGQLPQASWIPVERLGLVSDLSNQTEPGIEVSLLDLALEELKSASLIEELTGNRLRLHPLVQEFAGRLAENPATLRLDLAANLANALNDIETLEAQTARRGVDAILDDLRAGLGLLADAREGKDVRQALSNLARLLDREAHHLRGWAPASRPAFFLQQIAWRGRALRMSAQAAAAEELLEARRLPYLQWKWGVLRESPALMRVLAGHTGWVNAVALTPDGKRAVSASWDNTLRAWDLETGQEMARMSAEPVGAIAITSGGGEIVVGDGGGNVYCLRLWEPQE